MSRYIRTKNGVYELISDLDNKGYNVKVENHGTYKLVSKATILAQADTIEELCDELVVCDPQFSLPFTRERAWGSLYLDTSSEEKFKKGKLEAVYGSIWVDGNLIKVAKMNEKGELELL